MVQVLNPTIPSSVSDLPRGKHLIYSVRSRIGYAASNDDVGELLKYARDNEDLVLYHADYPEGLWVLGTSSMCADLARYTTSELLSYPFSVDPTFQMGKFEVTPVVYKTLMLKSRRTQENPIYLGPAMIHHKKTYDAYRSLAGSLALKCKGLTDAKGWSLTGRWNVREHLTTVCPLHRVCDVLKVTAKRSSGKLG